MAIVETALTTSSTLPLATPRGSQRRRSWVAAALLPLSLATALTVQTGCFGTFGLTRKIYGFNEQVSPDKWVRWVLFLAFSIIPVYGIGVLADAIILNSVEFWTGQNPINQASNGATPTQGQSKGVRLVQLSPSEAVRITKLEGHAVQVERIHNGKTIEVRRFSPSETGLSVSDGNGHTVSTVRTELNGSVVVVGPTGARIGSHSAAEVEISRSITMAGGARGLLARLATQSEDPFVFANAGRTTHATY